MRKLKYLAAAALSLCMPFFLGTMAVGIGLSDSGGVSSSYLRFLIFPHLMPAVCFFFLYLDEDRYRSFRPLVALFELGSLAFLAAIMMPAAKDLSKLMVATRDAQGFSKSAVAYFAALLIHVFCGFIIMPGALPRNDRKSLSAKDGDGTTIPTRNNDGGNA